MPDLEQAFQHWETMAELQLQFVEVLGEHKLQVAKSELVQAVAAQQWAVARMKATIALELEAALKRLRRQRHQTRRHIAKLGRHAQAAAKIRSGETLPASQLNLMWGGYTVLERLVPVSVLEELTDTSLHATAKLGINYADPRQKNQVTPDPPPDVDNVLALIRWLKHHRFVPRRGTQAYRQVIGAFAKIASIATTEIDTLQHALQTLEQDTYDTWKPVIIAALPDSVDAKKIISIGSK